MHFCNVYLNIDIYQSWHGAEYNMSKYFTSFLNLAILFASISANEMTAYYQKREYFSCCTTPTQKLTSNPASSFKIGGGGGGGGGSWEKIFCWGVSIKSKGWLRAFGLQKFMFYGNHIKNFSFYFIFQVLKMLLPYYISNILINIIITSLKM